MHFLAIWQRRYFLTFREQEREAGQNILLLFQLQCSWSVLGKKKTQTKKIKHIFRNIKNTGWIVIHMPSNQFTTWLGRRCVKRVFTVDPISSLFFRNISVVAPGSSLQPELFTQESRSDFPVWNILWFIGLRKRCSGLKRDPFTFVTLKDPKQRPPATKCIVPKWFVTFEPLILFIRSNK